MVRLTIVYDNNTIRDNLKPDWGFSCLVETGETNLLFDTGANGDILLHNMGALDVNPADIDAVVLSHDHFDHTGGLNSLLQVNPDIPVYKPTFSPEPREFLPDIMTTGALGTRIKEQSLMLKTNKGLIVVTGCSHPGLENILDVARGFGSIYAVIGGFHGFNKLDALQNIPLIVPCHCTQQKQRIAEVYQDAHCRCGAGKIIQIG